jgi:hypothetical protein
MNDVLITPIIMKEQHTKINAMVKGKGIVPNGTMVELYVQFWQFWHTVRVDYFPFISKFIKRIKLSKGVIQRLITLIFKTNEKEFSVNNKNLAIVHWEMAQGVHLYIRKRTNKKTLPFFPWLLLTIKF